MTTEDYINKTMALRNSASCPNCAETILLTYADDLNLTEETAASLASNFGGGMKSGRTCGAITGALMVLGGLGIKDPASINTLWNKFNENHNGTTDCAPLLKANALAGNDRTSHCNGMIQEAIRYIEELRA
jgi:C_GCAxxG_C_C family probable redox protein